tara:strand:- start:515 stop:760 length:246 start_codon:yes stop_codon:yes gene_type:complete
LGGAIIALTFLIATFWLELGLTNDETVWLAISMIFTFGINLAGFIFGFAERKKNKRKAIVAIIGNLIFILYFFIIVGFSLM